MLYRVHRALTGFDPTTLVVIGTNYIGSYKSNYLTMMTTTTPCKIVSSSINKTYLIVSKWQTIKSRNQTLKFELKEQSQRAGKNSLAFQSYHIGGLMCSPEYGKSWVRSLVGSKQNYKIGLCCFSANHITLKRKSKAWLARNQNNVFEWCDMSTRGLLFHGVNTVSTQLNVLV